jgi:ectoine hydroxylase-related dioxygenase (phytanoyl-CoA dioxygenase family)
MRDEPTSRFTWLDLDSAPGELERRVARGELSRDDAEDLRFWWNMGYVVFERCVSTSECDRVLEELDDIWRERRHMSIDILTDGRRTFVDEVDPSVRSVPYKLNDHYASSEAVRSIFFNERIVRFAERVFERPVVGCNSLTFERGTQQPAHIDHVYMTPTPARRLIAAWVALEDIRSEAGPLVLWPRSHRLPPFDFGSGAYHFTPELDPAHTAYVAEQKERFPRREFLARKGDVLLWHAFFVHGGAPILDPSATRKSMAFHYFSTEVVHEATPGVRQAGRAYYLAKEGA